MPVPEDAVEVNALSEEPVDPPDMEAFFYATVAGTRAELTQMQEFGVFEWKRKSEKPPNEKVIRTKITKPKETRFGQELWHDSTQMECSHLSTTQARHPRGH